MRSGESEDQDRPLGNGVRIISDSEILGAGLYKENPVQDHEDRASGVGPPSFLSRAGVGPSQPLVPGHAYVPEVLEEDCVIAVRRFSFWYGAYRALIDLDMPFPRARTTAVIGPSGSGKSTLARAIGRLHTRLDDTRHCGDILLNGESVHREEAGGFALRRGIGVVTQRPDPLPMSISENVLHPLRVRGGGDQDSLRSACERGLERAALWDEVRERLHQSAFALSEGQQRRLCLARALAADPEVLLLDEPCAALDPSAVERIAKLLQELAGKVSILLFTHDVRLASRVSDYTAFLWRGRLIEYGPTRAILTNPSLPETASYVLGRGCSSTQPLLSRD